MGGVSVTQLWRGHTLTDRGRVQEEDSNEGTAEETGQDAEGNIDEERTGQTNLSQW